MQNGEKLTKVILINKINSFGNNITFKPTLLSWFFCLFFILEINKIKIYRKDQKYESIRVGIRRIIE